MEKYTCKQDAEHLKELFKDGPVDESVIYVFMHYDESMGPINKYMICDSKGIPYIACQRKKGTNLFYDITDAERDYRIARDALKRYDFGGGKYVYD